MQKIQLIPSKFRHCALTTVVCNFCRRINTSLNSTTETYCSVALVSFQGHFISFKHQNKAQDTPCTKIVDDTTGKYCSVAFILMVTPQDYIHRLKSQNNLLQHNKQYYRKVLFRSFHFNGHTIGFHPRTQKLEPPCVA